jgi:polysaccharide biosynthesis/export protein
MKNMLRLLGLVCLFGTMAESQVPRPTAQRAQELLQSRPDLVAQLRQRLLASGLTPDQVRARLRTEGYPENLLDAYLPGGRPDALPDSASASQAIRALRTLGIVDSASADTLMLRGMRQQRDSLAPDDSLARDSTDDEGDRRNVIFGLDLFRRNTSQFDANLSGPVDENYRLGPGDQIVLILTGDVEEAYPIDVTREGFIVVPRVGQLPVANLTLGELNELLYSRLSRVYSGVRRGPGATTQFSVSVARLRSNQVFVVGDVRRPGSYRISSAGTALTALYAAGGPAENGGMRSIVIRRGARTVDSLDLYDYLVRGDASHDARLQTGDVVFVPVHGPRVEVKGEIERPAVYELAAGETLADLIRFAGGFSAEAARHRVQIERIAPPADRGRGGRDRLVIDVAGLTGDDAPAFALEDGDIVQIFPVSDRVRQKVTIDGNVWQPGVVGFRAGMRLSEALASVGGLKPDAYLGQVLISRLNPDSTRRQLRAELRDSSGAVIDDPVLQEDDEVRVFSSSEFRPVRFVSIDGAVRNAGRIEFREGMTLRDLVLLAGGLSQSADLRSAEIARLPTDRGNGVTAVTMRVPLDSSYLFERGRDGRYLGPPGIPGPAAGSPDFVLRPYDNVLILQQPGWQLQRSVSVGGEVRFPGRYTLTTRTERLSDLLQRAGGLTPEGYPEGVQFFRTRGQVGRIGIDLSRVLRDGRFRDNLLLEDGDSLHLPRYNPVVNVGGAVNSPVAVAFVPGKEISYYIQAAGGPTRNADNGRAFVLQPNGSVESRRRSLFLFKHEPTPRAGSVVTVPAREPSQGRDAAATVTLLSQMLASLVAVIAITRR